MEMFHFNCVDAEIKPDILREGPNPLLEGCF